MRQEDRPQKITFAEMHEMGVRGVLVYCADYRCSHSVAVSAPFSPRRATSTLMPVWRACPDRTATCLRVCDNCFAYVFKCE
jgi:hypothetical protein